MTFVAGGGPIELTFYVAQLAVLVRVILVEDLTGDAMIKRRRAPAAMALVAVATYFGEGHDGMAGAATATAQPSTTGSDTSTSRSTDVVRGGSDSAGKAGSDTSTSQSNDGSRLLGVIPR